MSLVLILVVLLRAAGIVPGLVSPQLRAQEIAAGALLIFVVALLSWLVLAYPGIVDSDRRLVPAGIGPGSPPSTVAYLVPAVLPAAVFACLSVLRLRAGRR